VGWQETHRSSKQSSLKRLLRKASSPRGRCRSDFSRDQQPRKEGKPPASGAVGGQFSTTARPLRRPPAPRAVRARSVWPQVTRTFGGAGRDRPRRADAIVSPPPSGRDSSNLPVVQGQARDLTGPGQDKKLRHLDRLRPLLWEKERSMIAAARGIFHNFHDVSPRLTSSEKPRSTWGGRARGRSGSEPGGPAFSAFPVLREVRAAPADRHEEDFPTCWSFGPRRVVNELTPP